MTNVEELRVAIARKNITKTQLAAKLGISRACLYKKLDNSREFKASEMMKLVEILSLNNPSEIFLPSSVTNNHVGQA